MCEVYRLFAQDWASCSTFTDDDIIELYNHESYGSPLRQHEPGKPGNGFALGKRWLDVTLAMWLEDIRDGILRRSELYEDGKFPHWWLDRVLNTGYESQNTVRS